MTVRRQTLEEWFTQHQLAALARHHFHLPFDMEVDVTALTLAYAAQGQRAPLTAIVAKAAAVVARERPEINRAVLATAFGPRVVQFEEAHVNMPVLVEHAGKLHLSATVIRHADQRSVGAIGQELKKAQARKLADLPIGRHYVTNRNSPFDQLKLRLRHTAAYAVPQLYERFGGGISVSSLVRPAKAGVLLRTPTYGPTAVSLCPGTVRTDANGRTTLFLGVGYDHFALPGAQVVDALERLGEVLVQGDPALFGPSPEAPSHFEHPPALAPSGACHGEGVLAG